MRAFLWWFLDTDVVSGVLCHVRVTGQPGKAAFSRWWAQPRLTRARAMPFRTTFSRFRCAQSHVHSLGLGVLARGRHRSVAHRM
jgi:hypothetical protein